MNVVESPVRIAGRNGLVRGVLATPEEFGQPHPALIVIPGAGGMDERTVGVGRRLAGEGYVALVIDPYSATPESAMPEILDFENLFPLYRVFDDRALMADLFRCYEYVASLPHVDADRIGALGFCAPWSLMFACLQPELRACVSFYNSLRFSEATRETPPLPNPVDRLPGLWAPVLYHRGADDPWQDPADVAQLAAMRERYAKDVTVHEYAGAGHGFAEAGHGEHPQQSDLAWTRTFEFLARTLRGASPA